VGVLLPVKILIYFDCISAMGKRPHTGNLLWGSWNGAGKMRSFEVCTSVIR